MFYSSMHLKTVVFLCSIIFIQQTLTALTAWRAFAKFIGVEQTAPITEPELRYLYTAIVDDFPNEPVTQELTTTYLTYYGCSDVETSVRFLKDQHHTVDEFVHLMLKGEEHNELK
ncbi:uncharacterized protein LOC126843908 [Adelges cooleyi]|uniref:uncharacterized protein LOC126843908 n=1 Tax=Adelges cooleyi TaxID=133065 RepID=UPI0021805B27|nr:uncharacterized protein LOC126843908 [Adelges cooleyi]